MKTHAAIFVVGLLLSQPLPSRNVLNKPHATTQQKVDCVARAIYHEARGEPLEGKLLVAQVVINRARHGNFGHGVCGVVAEPGQFSWYGQGKKSVGSQWQQAQTLARGVLEYGVYKPSQALWFHNRTVRPSWAAQRRLLQQVGNHKFYS